MKLCCLVFICFLLLSSPALGQTSNDLFNADLLQEIRLDVHPMDWQQLKDHFLENTHFPADMHWRYNAQDIVVEQASIRSRGVGSRSGVKPGLLVEFSRYNENQVFLGLRSIVLRNNTQDASMLHERISFALMQRLGLLVPRLAHTRLYVNDQYVGLYTIVESIDQTFLADQLGDEQAYLYNYDYGKADLPYFFEYRGADPALYSPKPFEPKTHETDPQVDRIVAMIKVMNQSSDAAFESAISEYLDLRAFLLEIAAEAYLADYDGIIGDFGLNNFYLYRLKDTNRFHFLPWDKSQAFSSPDRPPFIHMAGNVLSRRSLAITPLRDAFISNLQNAGLAAGGPGGWLEQEIIRAYLQIVDAARQDTNKLCDNDRSGNLRPCSNNEFEAAVADMIVFARQRNSVIDQEIHNALGRFPTSGYQPYAISDRGGAVFTTSPLSGGVTRSHGRVERDSSSAAPAGLALFGFRKNNILVAEGAVPAAVPLRAGRFSVELEGPTSTAVAIANPNSQPVVVTFYFTDLTGQDFGHGNTVIRAEGQLASFLNEAPFNGRLAIKGTFTFSATLPVGVTALRTFINERSEFLMSTLPIGDLFSAPSRPSLIPHFAYGGGWSNQIVLTNLEDRTISGTVEFRSPSSVGSSLYSIPPRSSTRIVRDGTSAAISTGFIRLVTSDPVPLASALFSFKAGGITVTETEAAPIAVGSAFRMYTETSASIKSSITIANPSASSILVRFELTMLSGQPLMLTGSLTIPGGERTAVFLNQIPGFESMPVSFQGILRVSTSGTPVSVLGMRSRYNERGDSLITAIPVVPESLSAPSVLSFPILLNSGGYETQIILFSAQSGQTVTGALHYRSPVGEPLDLGLK